MTGLMPMRGAVMNAPAQHEVDGTPSLDVVLVEDDDDVRAILRLLFELDDRFRLVGEAADGLTGIEVISSSQPAVVVLDMELPGATGAEVITKSRVVSPHSRIVVFSPTTGLLSSALPTIAKVPAAPLPGLAQNISK